MYAQGLRGVAVLCVVAYHYLFYNVDVSGSVGLSVMFSRGPLNIDAGLVEGLMQFRKFFNCGAFGVGLFFLISGFVIPISLTNLGSTKFLLARLARLIPCIVAVLPFYWAFFKIYASYSGYVISFSLSKILLSVFFALPSGFYALDSVLWTLKIEWIFYLYFSVLFAALFSVLSAVLRLALSAALPVVLIGALLIIFTKFQQQSSGIILPCFSMLLLGYSFYLLQTRKVGKKTFAMLVAVIICNLLLSLHQILHQKGFNISKNKLLYNEFIFPYLLALIVWGFCYWVCESASVPPSANNWSLQKECPRTFFFTDNWFAERFCKQNLSNDKCRFWAAQKAIVFLSTLLRAFREVLRFFAKISYPLYLLHPIGYYTGFVLVNICGVSFLAANAINFAFVVLISIYISKYVEYPSIALTKRFLAKLTFLDKKYERGSA